MRYPETASAVLGDVITLMEGKAHVTLQECIDLFGERSILMTLLFFSLLNSLPVSIPFVSTVTGIPIIVLGLHLLFSAKTVWLPHRLRERELDCKKILPRLRGIQARMRKVERVIRPRMVFLSQPPLLNCMGILFVVNALILALPIPFFNFPPGFSMSVLAVGLIAEDGIVISIGVALLLAIPLAFLAFGAVAFGVGA